MYFSASAPAPLVHLWSRGVRRLRGNVRGGRNARIVEADLARGGDDRGPGILGQRHAARKALHPRALLGLAREQNLAAGLGRSRRLHEGGIARDLARKKV